MEKIDSQGYWKIFEICREGRPFVFQPGLDRARLDDLMHRVKEAYVRFDSIPIVSRVASRLQEMVLVSSIHGTNSIEGGLLATEEVKEVIASEETYVTPEVEERRILNLKNAYLYAENLIKQHQKQPDSFYLTEQDIKNLHRLAMDGLLPEAELGNYRSRTDSPIKVSDGEHGGTYTPPICLEDIQRLMRALIEWMNSEVVSQLPVLYTAPLFHFYFERIHPFRDGNGRVGRILEAIQLRLGMGKFAAYAIWQFYWENIHEYFNVFNRCGWAEKKRDPYPNTAFVEFFLKGMLSTINRLHDAANQMIADFLFKSDLSHLLNNRKINSRQYAIATQLHHLSPLKRGVLNSLAWYNALYTRLTKQTKSRDLRQLQDLKLIWIDDQEVIRVIDLEPDILLSKHPDTQPDK